ncbi:hypothetical protein PCANC_00559 [Puccinia coronata f. sp. avenae]|uniref:Major facilitator superfamily (MFS) profile domain-containing protein n=1 Tax=Puccinia coronata f. sp. avenae TaxID=200324 RepID=A0A2N5W7V7_9BASI|nr:hypothetical protein PCANC_00559 [Puccinia coronata f. sp. avenae]
MSSPDQQNPAESNPMTFAHSSSVLGPDQDILTEKKLDGFEVTENSSPSTSLQLLPPREWKYAKFFPGGYSPNRQLPFKGQSMVWAVNIVAGIAIMFYGFDQGVMSGVNNTLNYQHEMGIFSQPQSEADAAKIGGIVAVYYVGTFIGALIGGSLGDRIGRLKTIVFACFWAVIGASLQASAQNITWMCCARVITGIGTGQLNALVPVWTSELSHHSGRGAAMGFEFMLNIAGLATAYWIEFALRTQNQSLRWRLPLALQVGFLVVLLILVPLFPESPRWLAKMGRDEDARQILSVLRYKKGDSKEELTDRVELELQGIIEVVQDERKLEEKSATTYWSMLTRNDPQHLRRRTWLIIWLQIMQELVGIGVVTVYAPTVFQQAGYSEYTADLLSGFNDISYMFSLIIAIVTLDRMGRRITLYWGAIVMGICLLICGIAARYVTDLSLSTAGRESWGSVVTAFTFIYTATFGATWLTVPWLIPTEIMPLYARAKGGCWSVVGWSIGNGIVTLIAPFLFNSITYWTFILFGLLNFFTLPNIYFLYPESAGRSLEDMDILFESDSIFVHKANYQQKNDLNTSMAIHPKGEVL